MRGAYVTVVKKALVPSGTAKVFRNRTNGGDSKRVLARLKEWAIDLNPDIVYFNCGLHDLKFFPEEKRHAVPIGDYTANLSEIIRCLKTETHAKIIFALSTPVVEEKCNAATHKPFKRYNKDVRAYNEAAYKVMSTNGIEVHDLHTILEEGGPEECLKDDGLHTNQQGKEILSRAVLEKIQTALAALEQGKAPPPPKKD